MRYFLITAANPLQGNPHHASPFDCVKILPIAANTIAKSCLLVKELRQYF